MFDKVIEEKLNIKPTDTIPEVLSKLLPYRSDLKYSLKIVDNYINKCRESYNNTKLTFGRYKGETLQWVINHDIDYIYWMIDNNVMNLNTDYMGIPKKK